MADTDWGLLAVLAIALLFIAWYYGGYTWNRRLARRLANELKMALLALGGRSSIQPFGTSAFRMNTEEADAPLREVSLTVTLRPREMPINWALDQARGRRDSAVIEASLRHTPKVTFELVDPRTRVGGRRARAKSDWSGLTFGGRELLLSADDERTARRFIEDLPPESLAPIAALHVVGGQEPRIAASFSPVPGQAGEGVALVKTLATRLTA